METIIVVVCERLQVNCINRRNLGELFPLTEVDRGRARSTRNFLF